MRIELMCCEMVMLDEIANPEVTLERLSQTVAMSWVSSENTNGLIDWKKVNAAIAARWGNAGGLKLQGMVRALLNEKIRQNSERN
jgi:hypothetical protein